MLYNNIYEVNHEIISRGVVLKTYLVQIVYESIAGTSPQRLVSV